MPSLHSSRTTKALGITLFIHVAQAATPDPEHFRFENMATEASQKNGSGRIFLTVLELLLGLVFLGYIMLWFVMPTNTYRNIWSLKLQEETVSTYFGRQGTTMLIYTFPIMFIAAVGCIHLHFSIRQTQIKRSSLDHRLAAWKRPVLVKGPLGVVSGIELFFFFMFIALLVWYFSVSLDLNFKRITPNTLDDGEKMWEAKLDAAGLRLGLVGNICLAFLFYPVSRGSSLLPLIGLRSESTIKYHIWLGHIALLIFTVHGLCYIIFWASTKEISEMLEWSKTDISNIAGELALLFGLIMWTTTFSKIRRRKFELFFYSHQLYILFMLFYLLHVGIGFFCYVLPGVFLFMLDRYLRFLQSRHRVRLISARLLPSETVELNFSKTPGLTYTLMSSVFINVPTISSLQWHPFTVSSSSNMEPDRLSVIIKKEGSWSTKLFQVLDQQNNPDRLDISVEGPYGPASVDFLSYDSLVMVSGGSGITPFISIIRELIHQSTVSLKGSTPSVLLICSFKNSTDLTMLDLLLPVSGDISDLSRIQLQIEAFVTREKGPGADARKLIRTIWFKPSPADIPLAPVLGTNGWLWMAMIISTSFIFYLILLGILNRYYIYPIDKNTNAVYPSVSKSLLNLLFICASIAFTASLAVLWNKRRSSMEAKQVQTVDVPATPLSSPSAWFSNPDREVESIPNETIVQATRIHYGKRPELKKMMLNCEGSNVGVMVCGPSAMRHEVAKICSSGLAPNLHFKSLSFSW